MELNEFDILRPIAVITGAASGLGLDLAKRLSSRYQLVLIDINLEQLKQRTTSLAQCHCVACNLSDADALAALISELTTHLSRVELLINNAGITHRSLAKRTQLSVIQKVMAVDYVAPVQLAQGLMPLLLKSHGKVVNIGSMAGWMPVIGRAGYCAAKSALHQYFETLRAELQGTGVTVLMVYPSFLDTPIEQNALDGNGAKASHKRSMVGTMRSSEWMAAKIACAIDANAERLFPDRFTHLSSLLYRLLPATFIRLMRRKFASELKVQA